MASGEGRTLMPEHGPVVRRLLTTAADDGSTDDVVSVAARHEAELTDGSRVLLLDDRGWSGSGPPDIWARTSVEDVVATTRTVVGPDEPYGDRTQEDMAAGHWAELSGVLRRHGVITGAGELSRLPHDVVLTDGLRERISGAGNRRDSVPEQ